jgi:hypothetical protein
VGDEWELRKAPAYHDEGSDLVADQDAIMDRDLVLNAIQPLCHLHVEGTGSAPADGRGNQHDVGPEDQRFIDHVELIGRVHLRYRAGPDAGMSALRVVALTSAEAQIVETDQARFDA